MVVGAADAGFCYFSSNSMQNKRCLCSFHMIHNTYVNKLMDSINETTNKIVAFYYDLIFFFVKKKN